MNINDVFFCFFFWLNADFTVLHFFLYCIVLFQQYNEIVINLSDYPIHLIMTMMMIDKIKIFFPLSLSHSCSHHFFYIIVVIDSSHTILFFTKNQKNKKNIYIYGSSYKEFQFNLVFLIFLFIPMLLLFQKNGTKKKIHFSTKTKVTSENKMKMKKK